MSPNAEEDKQPQNNKFDQREQTSDKQINVQNLSGDIYIGSKEKEMAGQELDLDETAFLPPNYRLPEHLKSLTDDLLDSGSAFQVGVYGFLGTGKTTWAQYLAKHLRGKYYKNQREFPQNIFWIHGHRKNLEAEFVRIAQHFKQAEKISGTITIQDKAKALRLLLQNKKVMLVIDQAERIPDEILKQLTLTGSQNCLIITTRDFGNVRDVNRREKVLPFQPEETIAYLKSMLGEKLVKEERKEALQLHTITGGIPLILKLAANFIRESRITLRKYNALLQNEQERLERLIQIDESNNSTLKLKSVFELTYNQIPADSRPLFRALSIFEARTFSQAALFAISDPEMNDFQKVLSLQPLVGRFSLIHPVEDAQEDRYRVNSFIRLFALEKLGYDEEEQIRQRALDYFIDMAHQASLQNQYQGLSRDWENLVNLISLAYMHGKWRAVVEGTLSMIRFEAGVIGFFDLRGYWSTVRPLLSRAQEAAQQAGTPTEKFIIATAQAGFSLRQSDFEKLQTHLQEVDALLSTVPQEDKTTLSALIYYYSFKARAQWYSDPPAALEWIERGLEILTAVNEEVAAPLRGYLLAEKAAPLGMTGQYDEARQAASQSQNLLPNYYLPINLTNLNNLAWAHFSLGNIEQFINHSRQGLDEAQQQKSARHIAGFHGNIALGYKNLGRLEEALAKNDQAIEANMEIGDRQRAAGFMQHKAQCLLILGRDEEAYPVLQKILQLADEHQLRGVEAATLSTLAHYYLRQEAWQKAADPLAQAAQICEAMQDDYLLSTVYRQKVQCLQGTGAHQEVLDEIETALEIAKKAQEAQEKGICYRLKGISYSHLGQPEEAEEAFEESDARLAEMDAYERAKTKLAYGQHLLKVDKKDTAQQHLQAALEIFDQWQAKIEQERTSRLLSEIQNTIRQS